MQLISAFVWTARGTRFWIIEVDGGVTFGGVFFESEPVFQDFT
jgi:hypothetical protein